MFPRSLGRGRQRFLRILQAEAACLTGGFDPGFTSRDVSGDSIRRKDGVRQDTLTSQMPLSIRDRVDTDVPEA
jgi:hypothetical protein